MTTMITSRPPIVGVPHLTMWLCGPFLADLLAEPDVAQEPHVGRHQDHDEREREQQALDQLAAVTRAGAPARRAPRPGASTTRSSSTPRDALTSTDVAGPDASRRDERDRRPRRPR